nr:hypothetical protein BaRGS_013104 [Batillaria attramentaria]
MVGRTEVTIRLCTTSTAALTRGDNRDDDNNDDRSARYDGSCDYPGTFENVITTGNNDNRTTAKHNDPC